MIVRWLYEREQCEVRQWMVSILVGVWCVEWRWCVLLLSCPVSACGPCPAYPGAVLIGTAVVSCAVSCRVCGVCVWVCVRLWWGILCLLPPRIGGGWGQCGWWGGMVDGGGMVSEGRVLQY
nr:MAG TPA: hypothetical protein [Caudoviricetes sp.]